MKTYTQPGSRFKKKSKKYSPRLLSIHEIVKTSSRNRNDPGGNEKKVEKQMSTKQKGSQKVTKKSIVYNANDDSEDESFDNDDEKSYVVRKNKRGKKRSSFTLPLLSDESAEEGGSENESDYEPKIMKNTRSKFKPSRPPLGIMSSSQAQSTDRYHRRSDNADMETLKEFDDELYDTQPSPLPLPAPSSRPFDLTKPISKSIAVKSRVKKLDKPGRTPPARLLKSRLLERNTGEHVDSGYDIYADKESSESEGSTDIFADPIQPSLERNDASRGDSSSNELEDDLSQLISAHSESPNTRLRSKKETKSSRKVISMTDVDADIKYEDDEVGASDVGFNVPGNMSFVPLKGTVKIGPHSTKRLNSARGQQKQHEGAQTDRETEAAKNLTMLRAGKSDAAARSVSLRSTKTKTSRPS